MHAALVNVFTAEYDRLLRVAYSILGNWDDAEDAISDAIDGVLVSCYNGNEIGDLRAYVFMAVKRRAISLLQARPQATPAGLWFETVQASQRSSDIGLRIDCERAVARLTWRLRQIVVDRYYRFLRLREIAEHRRLGPKAVYRRHDRAKEVLRVLLADYEGE